MARNANRISDIQLSEPHFGTGHFKLAPILEHVYSSEDEVKQPSNGFETKVTENETVDEVDEAELALTNENETPLQSSDKNKRKESLARIEMIRKMLSDFKGSMAISKDDNMKLSTDSIQLSDEDDKTKKATKTADKGAETYSKLCIKYKQVPVNSVMRQFGKEVISLDGYNLSNKELKAFFVALLDSYVNIDDPPPSEDEDDSETEENSPELSQLELSGNKVGVREITYLFDFVSVYPRLVSILLRRCRMCNKTMEQLATAVRSNKTLRKLDLSENNLTDKDSPFIADIIEHNEYMQELVLRKNNLGDGGTLIGEALVSNDTLKSLDLSWNHIRANGAIGICKGIRRNKSIETLLLAWNGFAWEGCAAMGWALLENTTLQTLDLTCNRIHPPALFELLKGLEKNKSLSSLKLSHNPITAPMTTIMLTRFLKAKESNLKQLDLEGIIVDKEFDDVLKQIQENRLFFVRYETSLPMCKGAVSQVDPKNIFNIDPIRILFFMKEHLRTIDLFLKFDKDCSNYLTRDEMKYAFEMEGFPISSKALDQVMGYLDTNNDGEVDLLRLKTKILDEVKRMERTLKDYNFSEFIEGERKLKRQLIQERIDAAQAEKAKDNKFSKTFTPRDAVQQNATTSEEKIIPKQRRLPPLKNTKQVPSSTSS